MLVSEGFKKLIPTARSLEDAVAEYNRIPSYPERARRNGINAIRLEVESYRR